MEARTGNRAAAALVLAAVTGFAPVQAQAPGPVRTVEVVDLDRYAGDWFEVARLTPDALTARPMSAAEEKVSS